MENDICPRSVKRLLNQVRVIKRNYYLRGVEMSRIRDHAEGLQKMVGIEIRELGVESRERSRRGNN